MRIARLILRGLPWIIIAILSIPAVIPAQELTAPDEADRFSKEELTQMLAPIALYPDSLIAQILMASTYPLEIVEAERWLRDNRDLKGEELDEALKGADWDPSVKSMCHFPDVLFALSGKLDQTRKLGDAFLAQEDEVASEIQELRRRAEDRGNLRSTREQNVIVEPEVIRIEPADTEVVYVPIYDPLYVYGPWWYPEYPPFYWYYPRGIGISGGFIGFGPRIFLGFGLFSWTWFDWNFHRIHVDYNRIGRFDRHHFRHGSGRHAWRHDPGHRRGVEYRDRRTSRHFGPRPHHETPRNRDIRGLPTRAPGTVTRETEPSRRQVERRRSATSPALPDRHRFENRLRRDTPSRGGGEGRFERRSGERRGENRRSVEVDAPRRTFRPQVGEDRPGGGSRAIERGVRSGGGDSRPRVIETRPRGVGTRSPGVEMRRQGGETRQDGGTRSVDKSGRHGGGVRNWGGRSEGQGQFRGEGRRQ